MFPRWLRSGRSRNKKARPSRDGLGGFLYDIIDHNDDDDDQSDKQRLAQGAGGTRCFSTHRLGLGWMGRPGDGVICLGSCG